MENHALPSLSLSPPSLAQHFRRNELEEWRVYDERVREIEHGSFSPLVFSTSSSMGPTATVVYKTLASKITEQNPPLDEMSPQLFPPPLHCYVSERQWIISLSSRSFPHRLFGPCLLRRSGPNILQFIISFFLSFFAIVCCCCFVLFFLFGLVLLLPSYSAYLLP